MDQFHRIASTTEFAEHGEGEVSVVIVWKARDIRVPMRKDMQAGNFPVACREWVNLCWVPGILCSLPVRYPEKTVLQRGISPSFGGNIPPRQVNHTPFGVLLLTTLAN